MRGEPSARGCRHAGVLATRRAIHADARVGGAGEARPAAGREAMAAAGEATAGAREAMAAPGAATAAGRKAMAAAAEAAPVAAGALSVAALPPTRSSRSPTPRRDASAGHATAGGLDRHDFDGGRVRRRPLARLVTAATFVIFPRAVRATRIHTKPWRWPVRCGIVTHRRPRR